MLLKKTHHIQNFVYLTTTLMLLSFSGNLALPSSASEDKTTPRQQTKQYQKVYQELLAIKKTLEERSSQAAKGKLRSWQKRYPFSRLQKHLSGPEMRWIRFKFAYIQALLQYTIQKPDKKTINKLLSYIRHGSHLQWPIEEQAHAYYLAGITFHQNNNLSQATKYLKKAHKQFKGLKNRRSLFRLFYTIIELISVYRHNLHQSNNLSASIDLYHELLELELKHKIIDDPIEELRIYDTLLSLYDQWHKHTPEKKQSKQQKNRSQQTAFRVIQKSLEQKSAYHLRQGLQHLSRYPQKNMAIATFTKKLNRLLKEKLPNAPKSELTRLTKLYQAILWIRFGAIQQAQATIQGLNLDEQDSLSPEIALIKGIINFLKGDYRQAINFYKFCLDHWSPNDHNKTALLGISFNQQSLHYLWGLAHLMAKELPQAQKQFSLSLEHNNQQKLAPMTLRVRFYQILVLAQKGRKKKALEQAQKLERQHYLLRNNSTTARHLDNIKLLLALIKGNPYQIHRYYKAYSSSYARQQISPPHKWIYFLAQGHSLRRNKQKRMESLIKAFNQYQYYAPYQNFIALSHYHIPQALLEQAFHPLLKSYYQKDNQGFITLTERLAQLSQKQKNQVNDPSAQTKFGQQNLQKRFVKEFFLLQNEFRAFHQLSTKGLSRRKRKQWLRHIGRAQKSFQSNSQKILSLKQQTVQQKEQTSAQFWGHTRKKLAPQTAILYYRMINQNIYSFVITRTDIKAYKLNAEASTRAIKNAQNYTSLTQNKDMQNFRQFGKALYRDILHHMNFLSQNKFNNLILVGDPVFLQIPFATLIDPNDKYLIESFSILHSLSLQKLNDPSLAQKEKWSLLALYYPEYENGHSYKHTNTEIELIKGSFQQKRLLAQDQLTQEEIFDDDLRQNFWHIALPMEISCTPHGPGPIKLLLGREDQKIRYLPLAKLSQTSRKDRALLFLSNGAKVCRYRQTNQRKSLQLIRFAQNLGFAYLIYSELPSKRDSALVISAFYRKLKRVSIQQALRKAQMRTMQRKPHPYYWAHYKLFIP